MAPFFRHESNAYGVWQAQEQVASPYRMVDDEEELRASGQYAVLTPEELIRELKDSPFPFTMLHPLCGGMPPELAWSSLRLFETQVLAGLLLNHGRSSRWHAPAGLGEVGRQVGVALGVRAPVDQLEGAGNRGRLVRGQEGDQAGHVLG